MTIPKQQGLGWQRTAAKLTHVLDQGQEWKGLLRLVLWGSRALGD